MAKQKKNLTALENEYNRMLQRAHRQWGQYKRAFATSDPRRTMTFEEATGYTRPQKITKGSIRRLEKTVGEARLLYEEQAYILPETIERVGLALQRGFDMISGNALAEYGGEMLRLVWKRMVDGALELAETIHSPNERAQWVDELEKFYALNERTLERFAYAVIDTGSGGFNTNTRWFRKDVAGNTGRQRFIKFAEDFCNVMRQPAFIGEFEAVAQEYYGEE